MVYLGSLSLGDIMRRMTEWLANNCETCGRKRMWRNESTFSTFECSD